MAKVEIIYDFQHQGLISLTQGGYPTMLERIIVLGFAVDGILG